MKKSFITLAIVSSLTLSPLASANDSKGLSDQHEEELSFGAGAIIGGIIGGPAGAMITGLASTFLMKNINSADEIATLEQQKQQQSIEFESQIAQLQQQMHQVEQQHQQELLAFEQSQHQASALQASNLMMSLQFATGSATVPDYYLEQVKALANILNQNEDLFVDLSGFTDLLGDSQLNQQLSEQRAESVKQQLVNLGVAGERINTFGYGDQQPVVANAQNQSSYYDRRVMINVKQGDNQTAKN